MAGISIQINYMQKAIIFGAPTKVDMPGPSQPVATHDITIVLNCIVQSALRKSMRQPLIEIGNGLS